MDKSILKKATADKPEPTPGHMYRDISQMTFADAKTPQKVADWLLGRVKETKSPHVMTKSLKVIKHVASYGHPDFQKCMQRVSDDLRPYTRHQGPRDPLQEDRLNQAVRDAAKEAFDAIYSEQHHSTTKNSLEGMGVSGGTASGGGVDPFRETDSTLKPKSNKLADAIAAKQAAAAQEGGGMFGRFTNAAARLTGMGANDPNKALFEKMEQQVQQAPAQQQPQPQQQGVFFSESGSGAGSPGGSVPWGFTQEPTTGQSVTVKDSDVLSPVQKLVVQYTSKASAPGRAEVSAFIREVTALETDEDDELAARLDERLDQKMTWQVRLSALTLIEALAKGGNTEVVEYFVENPEDVQKNVNVVQSTVKEKAKKVLALLKVPETNAKAAKPTSAPSALPAAFSMHADPEEEVAAPVAAGGKKKKGEKSLKLKKRKKSAAAAEEVTSPATPQPVADAGGDLFAGMMTQGAPQQQASPFSFVQQPQQAAPQPQQAQQAQLLAQQQQQAQLLAQQQQQQLLAQQQQAQQAQLLQQQQQQQQLLAQQQQQQAKQQQSYLDDLFTTGSSAPAPTPASPPPAQTNPAGTLSGLDMFRTPSPSNNPAPTPTATPLMGGTEGGNAFDLASALSGLNVAAASDSTAFPPTPVQSPSMEHPPKQYAEVAPAAPAAPPTDVMAQLQAQQAQIQAQIEALQRQQVGAHPGVAAPPQNAPPMPAPMPATATRPAGQDQFAFIGQMPGLGK